MMKIFKRVLSTIAAAALMTATLTACSKSSSSDGDSSSITFGTFAEFPPFEYIVAKGVIGEFDGIDISIAKQIGDDSDKETHIENMDFDSLFDKLDSGDIDAAISAITVTNERKQKVDFSEPYFNSKQVMIVNQKSTIAKASDMQDKKIVVIKGYTGESCVKKLGYSFQSFKKGSEAILELVNGKCDVVILDIDTAQKYVNDYKELKIVEDNTQFPSEEYAVAVKKGNSDLLEQINKTIKKMKDDGKISELAAKYADAAGKDSSSSK